MQVKCDRVPPDAIPVPSHPTAYTSATIADKHLPLNLNNYQNKITECLYFSELNYITNLNTITNLTERINKILDINITIDDEITNLKTILETIRTGLSLIKYNINVEI
jgi:hypothetical protein